MNTFGIRSINSETFNTRYNDNLDFPRPLRNAVITALRIHNAVLNVLGYIPVVQNISGCVRMATGLAIIGVTLAIGNRNATSGAIVGRWYDEAILTGIAQITRGALEALVPFGWVANAALDFIVTPYNLTKEFEGSFTSDRAEAYVSPMEDVDYPFPLMLLHVV